MTRRRREPRLPADSGDQPIRVQVEVKEIEDDQAAADLLRRILRAQARTAARQQQQEQKHDAA